MLTSIPELASSRLLHSILAGITGTESERFGTHAAIVRLRRVVLDVCPSDSRSSGHRFLSRWVSCIGGGLISGYFVSRRLKS